MQIIQGPGASFAREIGGVLYGGGVLYSGGVLHKPRQKRAPLIMLDKEKLKVIATFDDMASIKPARAMETHQETSSPFRDLVTV